MELTLKIYSYGTSDKGTKIPKSYVLSGKDATMKYKDKIKELGGKFNRFLKAGCKDSESDLREPGWIFGAKGWLKVESWLETLDDDQLKIVKKL